MMTLPHLTHGTTPSYGHISNGTVGEYSAEPICYANVTVPQLEAGDTCYFTLAMMFLIQLGAGMGGIALLSHGMAYIDDNVDKGNSAALIGEVIALRHVGPHLGLILAWRCLALYAGPLDVEPSPTSVEWVGAWWIGWPILSTLMFVTAVVIAMFPKKLPSQAVKEMAASIVDLARGVRIQEPVDPILTKTGFFWSLRRLLTNKIIILNTLATVCLQTAIVNYLSLEDKYLESKYYIPRVREGSGGFQDPWTSRLIIGLLKPPLVGMHILVSGLVISKMRMRAGRLTSWHAFIAISAAIFMFSRIFTDCPSLHIEGENRGSLNLLQTCNRACDCTDSTLFAPVCSEEGSILYYSPCHAGCVNVKKVDDFKFYSNCTCVQTKLGNKTLNSAKSGPCNNPDCNISWILNQCFTVFTAAMVGTRLVGNVILIFRSVQPKDKSIAVGLELTLVGLIAYVPAKLLYELMADSSCMYRGISDQEECKLYNADKLGLYINVTSGCLMVVCAILSIAVWYFARDLDFYAGDDDEELHEMAEFHKIRDPKISSRLATPAVRRRRDEVPTGSEEDVGTLREEIERMSRPFDPDIRFNLHDLSDHMEDSMEVSSPTTPNRPLSIY
ncbi:solute carrier organic anion transporter family member 74D-like isoform X2 [Periplaneta americana]